MPSATGPTTEPRSRLRDALRAVPVDVWALIAITLLTVPLSLRYLRHGMCFNDPSWYFHFGNRTLHGDVPYRDYVFQVGPLPVYVDALYQHVFGAKYMASIYAALTIKVLRILAVWMIVRRIASLRTAAALTVFCVFDPLFAFGHHWSTAYGQLFITLAALFILLATRAAGRRELVYLALAGLSASLVVSARQSAAVMIGVVLFAATAILLVRKEYVTPRRFIALWGGFAAGFVLVFGAIALTGALGPAVQQMFLDAPQKKNIQGLDAVLDAISGGAFVAWDHSLLGGFLRWLAVPTAVVGAAVYALARSERLITARTIASIAVPGLVLLGLLTRHASFDVIGDLPRMFLTAICAFAVLAPSRMRGWFGVEPIIAVAICALPLASDWALEMSFPGRGWGDSGSLITGSVLFVLASSRIAGSAKRALCIVMATLAVLYVIVLLARDKNPFAKHEAAEGTLTVNHHSPRVKGQRIPLLRGLRLPKSRVLAIEWLAREVPAGSSCFIYGNTPVLYDLLDCTNPTRIDTTAADFITAGDADAAVAIMRAQPPQYIIAHEKQWMSPPLTQDLGTGLEKYDGLNPRASRAMHVGLRELLPQYVEVGYIADVLGPGLADQAAASWDALDAVRLYRRVR